MRMQFGNRLAFNRKESNRRSLAYYKHLAKDGFTVNDKAYRLFAVDLFHDGPITIQNIDLGKKTLCLKLRNVCAFDALLNMHKKKENVRKLLRKELFETLLTFGGIDRFNFSSLSSIHALQFYSAELSKERGRNHVLMTYTDAVYHGSSYGGDMGYLSVYFDSVKVQDRTDAIATITRMSQRRVRSILYPVRYDPEDLSARFPLMSKLSSRH